MAKSDGKNIKLKYTCKNGAGKYVITYSSKDKELGSHMLSNVLSHTAAIINIDTSLSFMDKRNLKEYMDNLKKTLQLLNVSFCNRTIKPGRSEMSGWAQMLLYGRISGDREIVTFELNEGFYDQELFGLASYHGCEIFSAENLSQDMIQDVFNCNYEDTEKRLSSFKYVLYINDFVGQAALYTRTLSQKDVEAIYL